MNRTNPLDLNFLQLCISRFELFEPELLVFAAAVWLSTY
jgi:hypothetical protein